jgi:hypothetical protein
MPAVQIDCICTERDAFNRRQITHVSGPGTDADGERWKRDVAEVVRALQSGTIYYATFNAESYIVTFGVDPAGRRFLRTALGEADSSMLLRLPECG